MVVLNSDFVEFFCATKFFNANPKLFEARHIQNHLNELYVNLAETKAEKPKASKEKAHYR